MRKRWMIELIYTTGRKPVMVWDESGDRRPALFPSKASAKECQRVISALITASHFEGSTLIREK